MSVGTNTINWGLSGSEGETDVALLQEKSLLTYSGRQGSIPAFGGLQDQVDMSGGYGVLRNQPVKTLFLGVEAGCGGSSSTVDLRISYDIVSLTTSEQAELYQKGLCG